MAYKESMAMVAPVNRMMRIGRRSANFPIVGAKRPGTSNKATGPRFSTATPTSNSFGQRLDEEPVDSDDAGA